MEWLNTLIGLCAFAIKILVIGGMLIGFYMTFQKGGLEKLPSRVLGVAIFAIGGYLAWLLFGDWIMEYLVFLPLCILFVSLLVVCVYAFIVWTIAIVRFCLKLWRWSRRKKRGEATEETDLVATGA